MRTKLLALALAATLAIGTGGVVADGVSTGEAQFANDLDDGSAETPQNDGGDADDRSADDERGETPDERLTADEHVQRQPSIVSPADDGTISFAFQEPAERTVTVGAGSDGTVAIEPEGDASDGHPDVTHTADEARAHYHDAEMTVTGNEAYDEKLTAEESVTLDLREEGVEMTVTSGEAYDAKLTADMAVTLDLDEDGIETTVTGDEAYDAKLTADEHVERQPSVLAFEGDGIVGLDFQEPSRNGVTADSTGNGTLSVEMGDA